VSAADGNAFAVSRTMLPELARGESKKVVFTWQKPFAEIAAQVDVRVRSPLPH